MYRWVTSKEIKHSEIPTKKKEAAEVLSLIERDFPTSILDIQVHLIAHLVDEISIAGPVRYRWMYPIERFLKTVRSLVRQLAHPEGSIAEKWLMQEALSYNSGFLKEMDPFAPSFLVDPDHYPHQEIQLQGGETRILLPTITRNQVHKFVILNSNELAGLRSEYDLALARYDMLVVQFRAVHRRTRIPTELRALKPPDCTTWIRERVDAMIESGEHVDDIVVELVLGPSRIAKSHSRMWIGGVHLRSFLIEGPDAKTQDSWVMAPFWQQHRSSTRDRHVVNALVDTLGRVFDILDVDYRGFRVTLLKCEWVRMNLVGQRATVFEDECGFKRVNIATTLPMDTIGAEPFVFPSQVEQVCVTPLVANEDWAIVVDCPSRSKRPVRTELHEEDV